MATNQFRNCQPALAPGFEIKELFSFKVKNVEIKKYFISNIKIAFWMLKAKCEFEIWKNFQFELKRVYEWPFVDYLRNFNV